MSLKPKKKCCYVIVFWFTISSWNCYNKHDIYNLIYMNFPREKTFKAMCVKSDANISRRSKNHKWTWDTTTWFSCIRHVCGNSFKINVPLENIKNKPLIFFGSKFEINILNKFNKIQNLKKRKNERCILIPP